jgi:hypothetical protein
MSEGEGMNKRYVGTLVFIGILVAVNAASYFFHWGFWLW